MHVLLRAQGHHLGASAPQSLRDSHSPAPISSHSDRQWETCVAAAHLQMKGHMQVQGSPVVAGTWLRLRQDAEMELTDPSWNERSL